MKSFEAFEYRSLRVREHLCAQAYRAQGFLIARVVLGALLVAAFGVRLAVAQPVFIQHAITQAHESPPTMGREFWFAIPSNFWGVDEGGKYLNVYITSPVNTTAYIQIGSTGATTPIPVTAYKISTYKLPESAEMESSGLVTDGAVHVWSTNADLTVYFMSHNEYTSDGSYIIPTIGWGTDYVVAGYGALLEATADYPSEFTICANTDNTQVQITPSCDMRQGTGQGASGSVVVYPAGQTFNVTLNRGQSEQFMSVVATDVTGFDVSGTIIHSNNPIGVIGGSMCPNIPPDFPYCDHVEDMMPPLRTWASTYYSTYFSQPSGQQGHDFGLYLFISSKPGQVIYRENITTGPPQQECVIASPFGTYWDEIEKAQKFFSDAPFLLVEYINSSSYPDGKNGFGDPAEVVINPREQYTKTVVFQSPANYGGQLPYDNYATVTVNVNDTARTTFDGQSLRQYNKYMQPVDDTFLVFTVPHITPGVHIVQGDSAGVGVYVYGYGYDESYAWAGSFGLGTFHPTDTMPPVALTHSACYDAFIHLADTGSPLQTKLGKIEVDSIYNMNFVLDSDWSEGVGLDTSGYGMSVVDLAKAAYLKVSVYDLAGNVTTITSTYSPNDATITPPVQDFGTVASGGTATAYDTIRNIGTTPFDITELKLELDTAGFTLVNPDLTPLAPDSIRLVEIQFKPRILRESYDTISFSSACLPQLVVVEGNAGGTDFSVDDQNWKNVPLQKDTGWIQLPVVIHNKSSVTDLPVTFDSVSDTVHFYLAPYQSKSVMVPKKKTANGPDGLDSVWFIYQPTVVEQDGAKGYWESSLVTNPDGSLSIRNDSLHGNPVVAAVTFLSDVNETVDCPAPGQTLHFAFILRNTGTANAFVNRVYASDSLNFTKPKGVTPDDSTWDPSQIARLLPMSGGVDSITVDYHVPTGVNAVAVDTLTAYGSDGSILGGKPVIVRVVVNQLTMVFTPSSLDFGSVAYKSPKISKSFTIRNPNATPITYTNLFFGSQSGNSNRSYSFSTNPSMPVTLQQGDSLVVTVTFDPGDTTTYLQWADLKFTCNACDTTVALQARDGSPTVLATGSSGPAILACNRTTDSISLVNYGSVPDTVIWYMWLGPDTAQFVLPANFDQSVRQRQVTVPPLDSIHIPVDFIPNSQDSGLQIHADSIEFGLSNGQTISTTQATISDTANYVDVKVTSQFPPPSGTAGSQVELPLNIAINPRNLKVNTTDLNITGVRLVYLLSNPDLLNIDKGDVPGAVSGLPAGWKVSPGSYVSRLGDTLILVLNGPALPNNTTSLGRIAFRVTLPAVDSTTNVTLDSLIFYSGPDIAGCINPMIADSTFSLIMQCGNATVRGLMQGKGIIGFVRPAIPDPVSGSNVTFTYTNEVAANLTLTIYDVLGREVARPIDNLRHEAGSWQISYNVAKLPNGTYTYRLSTDGYRGHEAVSKQFIIAR